MCCRHDTHHEGGHNGPHFRGPSACDRHEDIRPCFWSKREKIAYLEEYLEDIKNKWKSVDERISALKEEE